MEVDMVDGCRPATVLIVEDEAFIRMLGAEILEEAGFKVVEANDADEALGILREHDDVRLVFSDVDMPGSMDGLGLTKFVHERWPTIRLLLTSGRQHLEEEVIPDDGKFVSKPWSADALIAKVRQAMES
jgi:DNA-binding NtrC family response regulator